MSNSIAWVDEALSDLAEQVFGLYGSGVINPPPKPKCEKQYRIKDTGPEQYRGRIFSTAGVMRDDFLGVYHIDNYVFSKRDVELVTTHEFPNSGCARSWCDRCGVVGTFNWRSGKFDAQ